MEGDSSTEFCRTFTGAGMMRNGKLYPLRNSGRGILESESGLPVIHPKKLGGQLLYRTPDANMERGTRSYENMKQRIERGMPINLNDQLNAINKGLWPTPTAYDWNTAVKSRTEPGSKTYRGNLKEAVQLWSTPKVQNSNGSGIHGQGVLDFQTAVRMFPTLQSRDFRSGQAERVGRKGYQDNLNDYVKLFPTPTVQDYKHRGPNSKQQGLAVLWPTPNSRDWKDTGATQGNRHSPNLGTMVQKYLTPRATDIGKGEKNETFIKRMGDRTDNCYQSLPAQVGGQLNPDWVEALMGYPQGWTDIEREATSENIYPQAWLDGTWEKDLPKVVKGMKNRAIRLKGLGNAVVPQIPAYLWGLIAEALW